MSFEKYPVKDLPLKILDGDRGKEYPKKSDFYSEGFCLFFNISLLLNFFMDSHFI